MTKKYLISSVVVDSGKYISIDIDVSPLNNSRSKKKGVSWTYKKHDGYSPNFAYAGLEGYMINCELRPGIQHSQKGTQEFIRETMSIIEKAWNFKHKTLFRFDSGNDSNENIAQFKDKAGPYFIIKGNLKRKSAEEWLEIAKKKGIIKGPRTEKKVWLGHVLRDVKEYGPTR